MRTTSQTLKRIVAQGLLAGGVAVAGVGFGAATAHATTEGPFTWCPGQSMDWPTGPNKPIDRSYPYTWNMNVCHTWYKISYGYGNVRRLINGTWTLAGSTVWDGDNPPVPEVVNCGPGWCPLPPRPDPNFHGGPGPD